MKPPLSYFGGKASIADRIVALLPAHEHYVEPFAGSLAVLLAKQPSPMETVNDLDERLCTFWRVLREQPEALHRACTLTPHSRAGYLSDVENLDDRDAGDVETARRVWSVLIQGRARSLSPTGWRFEVGRTTTGGGRKSVAREMGNHASAIPQAAQRLAAVTLECRPALEVIAAYGSHPSVLIYADPPYLATTRSGTYGLEMAGESEHHELAQALLACRAAVVLSGYDSPLYAELYAGWWRQSLSTNTGNGTPGSRSRTEMLWSNRPLEVQHGLFEVAS